jgi:membrane protease YdiL (CAAX protease family)
MTLTPVSGVTTWLVALILVFVAHLALAGAAALLAMAAGLPADRALRLLLDPEASPLVTNATWIALTILVNELGVAAALFIALRRLRLRLTQVVPFTRPLIAETFGTLLLVFGLAPMAELAAELVYRYFSRDMTSEQMVQALARGSSGAGLVLVLLVAAVLPALVEESLFRGLVFRAFERYGALVTIAVTSLLFGALHLNPSQAAGTVVLGVAFGLARWQTRSVTPALIGHALYNAAVIISERLGPPGDRHELAGWHVVVGVAAAGFGWWLLGDRHARRDAV